MFLHSSARIAPAPDPYYWSTDPYDIPFKTIYNQMILIAKRALILSGYSTKSYQRFETGVFNKITIFLNNGLSITADIKNPDLPWLDLYKKKSYQL